MSVRLFNHRRTSLIHIIIIITASHSCASVLLVVYTWFAGRAHVVLEFSIVKNQLYAYVVIKPWRLTMPVTICVRVRIYFEPRVVLGFFLFIFFTAARRRALTCGSGKLGIYQQRNIPVFIVVTTVVVYVWGSFTKSYTETTSNTFGNETLLF